MMTGTATVNQIIFYSYFLLLFSILTYLSVLDIRTRTVPNRLLLKTIPVFLFAPFIWCNFSGQGYISFLLNCLSGILLLGISLISVAIITHGAIGGGDIKLILLLCMVYGLGGMLIVLSVAITAALLFALIQCAVTHQKAIHLPLVPFLFFGCVTAFILNLL